MFVSSCAGGSHYPRTCAQLNSCWFWFQRTRGHRLNILNYIRTHFTSSSRRSIPTFVPIFQTILLKCVKRLPRSQWTHTAKDSWPLPAGLPRWKLRLQRVPQPSPRRRLRRSRRKRNRLQLRRPKSLRKKLRLRPRYVQPHLLIWSQRQGMTTKMPRNISLTRFLTINIFWLIAWSDEPPVWQTSYRSSKVVFLHAYRYYMYNKTYKTEVGRWEDDTCREGAKALCIVQHSHPQTHRIWSTFDSCLGFLLVNPIAKISLCIWGWLNLVVTSRTPQKNKTSSCKICPPVRWNDSNERRDVIATMPVGEAKRRRYI